MNDLTAALNSLQAPAQALAAASLSAAQQPFAKHIVNMLGSLQGMVDGLPDGEAALSAALPLLGGKFQQGLVALYGYARLLLERPESFEGQALDESARPHAQLIYEAGQALATRCERLSHEVQAARSAARSQSPAPFDLAQHLAEQIPLYRFFLKSHAVQVRYTPTEAPHIVYARQYHVSELLRHIVVTLGTEIVEYGTMTLHLENEPSCIAAHITCSGAQLNPEQLTTLFTKNGRHTYREQLDADEGYLTFLRQTGVSGTIVVHLPRFGSP
jgi:hypothetical protein